MDTQTQVNEELTKMVKDKNWEKLYRHAHQAGHEAATKATPRAMLVYRQQNPFDDDSPVEEVWNVPEGVCGFAWVLFKPATHAFVRWLKKEELARSAYGGGYSIWVSDYGQSMERKEAYARAFAKVMQEAFSEEKLRVYAQSRMD